MSQVSEYYSSAERCYHLGRDKDNVHNTIIEIVGSGKTILDVGCSEGYLGRELKEKGNMVTGIEISGPAADKAKDVLDRVIIGNIEEDSFTWPPEKYDIIICADLLEHLFEPKRTLEKMRKLLAPKGRLIISLPNIANYWIRKELLLGRFEYHNGGLLDQGHLRHFTYDTAARMFREAGYMIYSQTVKIELPAVLEYPNRLLRFIRPMARKYFYRLFGYQFVFILLPADEATK